MDRRATISTRVTGGTHDPVKEQEFKKRADAERRKKMRKIMEREARIDQADHEPRKLIIINELIKYLSQKQETPGEINYREVIQNIVNAFGKIPNRKRREFKRIEDELRDVKEEIKDYKRTIVESSRMLKSLAKEQGRLKRARIQSDHYLHSDKTQAEVLTNEDKKLITDTLRPIAIANGGVSIQKVIQNLKQRELYLRTKQHRFKMRSRKRKASRKTSRKRKASRKRSRKRRSAKRKTSRKRRSAKRKTSRKRSRKRRSAKRKTSRKRSRKRRSSKRCPTGCVKKKTSKRKSRKVKKS